MFLLIQTNHDEAKDQLPKEQERPELIDPIQSEKPKKQPKPLHLMTIKEIKIEHLYNKKLYAKHIAKGLAMTVLSPLVLVAGVILNLSILIFRSFAVMFTKFKLEHVQKLKRQGRKTIADPALTTSAAACADFSSCQVSASTISPRILHRSCVSVKSRHLRALSL